MPAIHPSEVLREEFLAEHGLSAYAVAKAIKVPRDRIESIIREKRSVTADTAMRLGLFFETTPQFWLNLQNRFDLAAVENAADAENLHIAKHTKTTSAADI